MKSFLLAVVVGYVIFVAGLYVVQRRFMYVPGGPPASPSEAGVPEMRTVSLTTDDGLNMLAWFAPPLTADHPTILYFHGNAGTIQGRAFKARRFIDAGFGVLFPEYRGFGGNPGAPSEAGFYRDGRAALRFLAAEGISPGEVVIYGESLGSGVAVQMAHELTSNGRPASGLILEAPFMSMTAMARLRFAFVPVQLLLRDRYDNAAKLPEVESPLLVIHGTDDATVPFEQGERLFNLAGPDKERLWVPGAGHVDLYDFGVGERVVAFTDLRAR